MLPRSKGKEGEGEMTYKEALDKLDKTVVGDLEWKIALTKALERQIPTKVTHEASLYKYCTCPNCKNVVNKFEKWGERTVRITYKHCHFCGQNLDWQDETRTPQNDEVRE